jgi:Kef-type K+ transport system membrane component KefB
MVSLTSIAIVSVAALAAPFAVTLFRLPLPAIVLEILLGVILGPQVLGVIQPDDAALQVFSTIGLGLLLLLAGLEIDLLQLRGPVLRRAAGAFVASVLLALTIGVALGVVGLVQSPVLVAVILTATGLGVILPILQDSGHVDTEAGRLIVAGASIAEVVPIVSLSVSFSEEDSSIGARMVLLAVFLGAAAVVVGVALRLEHARALSKALLDLQDSTAEIRVRAALTLLLVFAVLATGLGFELILGAFLAGAAIRLLDRDDMMSHTRFSTKLHAVGFGVFVPVFFVGTGVSLDVRGVVDHPAALAEVPIFVVALLIVRGAPAVLYHRLVLGDRRTMLAVALFQATSLSIPVVAGAIGVELGLIRPTTYAALVMAGLLSVIAFPPSALRLLGAAARPLTGQHR